MKNSEKIDENMIENDKIRNFKDRIWFIKYWANFIKTHSDEEWSKGHNILIDSQFQHARNFYKNLEKTENGRTILKRLIEERKKVRR